MTMRKYLVTVHRDGTLSCVEYDEPSDYPRQYRPKTKDLMRYAYNEALDDVVKLLDVEIERYQRKEWDCRHDAEECMRLVSKASECSLLKIAISTLYRFNGTCR